MCQKFCTLCMVQMSSKKLVSFIGSDVPSSK